MIGRLKIMKNNSLIIKAVILTLILSMLIVPSMCLGVSAAEINTTVNLAYVKQHVNGDGYYWDNVKKVLTLNDLNINTDDAWGLRLPEGATIELKGTNTIKSGKYALGCPGNVTVTGNGKLILESGEHAIFVHTENESHKFRVFGGEIIAKGNTTGFYSEHSEFSMTGGKVEFSSNGDYAVNSRVFSMTGGKVTVDGTLRTTHLLRLNESELTVSDDKKALETVNLFEYDNIKLTVGDAVSSLSEAKSYKGEKCFKSVPVPSGPRDSILFGEGTPITVDYILLGCTLLAVASLIVVPVVIKKRKVKKMYASLGKEE